MFPVNLLKVDLEQRMCVFPSRATIRRSAVRPVFMDEIVILSFHPRKRRVFMDEIVILPLPTRNVKHFLLHLCISTG